MAADPAVTFAKIKTPIRGETKKYFSLSIMDEICRLCCSPSFVKNYIFDESTALHLKMSLYMPIKVFKNDRLPQRICDRCSCRVNDMYQFCNEAIEVQNRLRAALIASGVVGSEVDLTSEVPTVQVKLPLSPLPVERCEQFTQTEPLSSPPPILTDPPYNLLVKVKEEPDLKPEYYEDLGAADHFLPNAHSDESDNVTLNSLKKKKKRKYKKVKTEMTNGDTKKKKKKQKKWDLNDLMGNMPEGLTVGLVGKAEAHVKQETDDGLEMKVKVKTEEETYNCCICFMKCFSRIQMLQHYKEHAEDMMMPASPPPPPPLPDTPPPLRCPRCSKVLEPAGWDEHWRRHWERDRRPFRCARCERAFRHPHQILAHGQTHDNNQETAEDLQEKRFICDLCPEGFVYMRYLLSHRARAHPEAGCAAPTLRCAECSREFAHLNSLRRHLRAHSGRRDHLCSVCGKALSSREHLKFHLRIHAGYKPNVCKTCGKGFVKKCNLTLHERTHSGEKPYVCAHCSKAFSQRSTLVIHERIPALCYPTVGLYIKHVVGRYHSGARPYVCSLCGRGFVAKGLLSMHLKTTCI